MSGIVRLYSVSTATKPDECGTKAFRDVTDALAVCHRLGQIAVVVGSTGCGKTFAARAYARKTDEAAFIRMTDAANTTQPFLVRLAEAVGAWGDETMSKARLFDNVVDRLKDEPKRVLIIDEMNKSTPEVVHIVRDIWDECHCGIALVGTPEMELVWCERTGRKAGKGDPFAAFRARIGQYLKVDRPSADDAAILARYLGFNDKREADIICRRIKAWDGLHNLDRLLESARQLTDEGDAITADNLVDADSLRG